ncbi:phosphomethylpyrimidine kinase [Acidianus sulfidivorans JP7]|uniref:Phosphomethylpyrimidine kinase n=1 Tax=Acidianus sulfidivorans JP7 TaxID=619593 RepID=A0A2U9IK87_9CREN|nr:thiamine-phosphate synthase family protein [Acidianus sulfidivorans]AWR96459.1 phosphomethylpyrimidine kinase [Acidianus sulfidivorans JP7]
MEERSEILVKLKEATDYFISNEKSYLLIPEIRTNFGYALPNAKNENDVAAIPGRLTVAFKKVIYCLPPAFGASDHIARVILTAMKYDKDIRSAIDLKYYEKIVNMLNKIDPNNIYIFNRKSEPEESRKKEGHTMNYMIDLAFNKLGKIPTFVVDLGDYGKEPTIFVLGKDPMEVAKISLELLRFL